MKKIYFVRHGQSEYNFKNIYSGNIDTKLTVLGKQQAYKTGQLLKDKNVTSILSSDLSRAYNTALNIKDIIDPDDSIDIQSTPLLQEVFFGDIQGQKYSESCGLIYAIDSGTGESAQALYDRGTQVLELIHSIKTEGDILVVGHGLFSSIVFAVSEGKTEDDLIDYRLQWNFYNGEIKEMHSTKYGTKLSSTTVSGSK